MNLLFICKASTDIGYGHFIRSLTAAKYFLSQGDEITFCVIGDTKVQKLIPENLNIIIVDHESEIELDNHFDGLVWDLMDCDEAFFKRLRKEINFHCSISPVFNYMEDIDVLFTRTKYLVPQQKPKHTYSSLDFAIIQDDCERISTDRFAHNLDSSSPHIAISMGGGDAANKTLDLLKYIQNWNTPAVFWVMLGEGYKYSYDNLIKSIRKDSKHEIILAKTNRSMWHILQNCCLVILPGGITVYEAAYAGLPSICFLESESHYNLIQELFEKRVSVFAGSFSVEHKSKLPSILDQIFSERDHLLTLHESSKNLIDKNGVGRIRDKIISHLGL